ncbi:hypothetical protein HOY80DRAFT_585327 [Tuber brumale]|nr:hypothetical protein HOY80DRAFT_585327 [Tuber brumale]
MLSTSAGIVQALPPLALPLFTGVRYCVRVGPPILPLFSKMLLEYRYYRYTRALYGTEYSLPPKPSLQKYGTGTFICGYARVTTRHEVHCPPFHTNPLFTIHAASRVPVIL